MILWCAGQHQDIFSLLLLIITASWQNEKIFQSHFPFMFSNSQQIWSLWLFSLHEQNITLCITGDPERGCAYFVTTWAPHTDLFQRVMPRSHWETGSGKLLPSRETSQAGWLFNLRPVDVQVLCEHENLIMNICASSSGRRHDGWGAGNPSRGHLLEQQPCQNRWLPAKIQETPSGLAMCLYIRYMALSER